MQRDGERAGLERAIPLWRTERTYVIAAPSRGRRSNDSGRLHWSVRRGTWSRVIRTGVDFIPMKFCGAAHVPSRVLCVTAGALGTAKGCPWHASDSPAALLA
eukprot:scaffold47638_cov33-Phaeocystis_antarctica.AAC.1